jgi:hypothetical protein
MKRLLLPIVLAALAGCSSPPTAPAVKLTRLDDRVRVEIGGQLFTEYVFKGASQPYCYPVLAPDDTPLTRDFPMKETAGEDTDHPWQRSLFFAHGEVNGVDFWNEGVGGASSGAPATKGLTQQEAILETTDGATGVLRVRNRLVAPDGRLIYTDERTLRFSGTAEARQIDYEVTLHAPADAPLKIADSKEGTMAIRVAQWMTMPHNIKDVPIPGVGHILTAGGDRDATAWGKRADWCDYYALRGGQTYGVAIFDHPSNLRHPTWWMARDYGLFAANPFGQTSFETTKEKPAPPGLGNHTIPAGGSLTLRYRFYFHTGDPESARIAHHYAAYAAGR